MLEPGIAARGDEAVHLVLEWGNPVRIVGVETVSELDEGVAVGAGEDAADLDGSSHRAVVAGYAER